LETLVYNILVSPKKKKLVLLLTFLAFLGSVFMFPTNIVLAKMLPGKSTNTFSIYVDLPNGSSFEENQKVNQCIVSLLQNEKEVRDIEVFSGMGSPLDYAGLVKGSGFKMGEHLSEIVVNLSDLHERDERSYSMVHRLRPIIQKACEPLVERTSIKMVEQPAGPPTLSALVIELYGEDEQTLRALSKELKSILERTPDLVDVDILNDDIYTKYTLVMDTQKVMHSNVAIDALQSLLYLSFEGAAVAHKNSDMSPAQVPIFVVLSEGSKKVAQLSRAHLEAKLASVMIPSQSGTMIPLNTLVHIEERQSTPTIMSKNLQKMVTIVAEADLVSQVYPLLDARSAIKERLKERFEIKNSHLFDLELKDKRSAEVFQLVWDGEMKVTMDTFRDLGGAFIAALVLIFLLMVVYYKSFAISGIILLGSFLSIIGVIVGHWVMDVLVQGTFFLTATSLIGFISLMGISSRNSLLLIDFSMSLMQKGMEKKRSIAVSAATRAKPIFLTALAIILASTLLATDPVFGGLGVALIFGTIAAVIVSLIVVPVLMDNTHKIH
jgi:multidrug efflux pump subunit AcrB